MKFAGGDLGMLSSRAFSGRAGGSGRTGGTLFIFSGRIGGPSFELGRSKNLSLGGLGGRYTEGEPVKGEPVRDSTLSSY